MFQSLLLIALSLVTLSTSVRISDREDASALLTNAALSDAKDTTRTVTLRPWHEMDAAEDAKHLDEFNMREAKDKKYKRNGTEVVTSTVYRFQFYSQFSMLSDCNAALEIGELHFIQAFATPAELVTKNKLIVRHEVEYKRATNMNRATRHYVQYNGVTPNKDPVEYGIDTVGVFLANRGGWLSFPHNLKCTRSQTVGDGCAWRDNGRKKSIQSACLMHVIDDGPGGSMRRFSDVYESFRVPGMVHEETLDPPSKLALKLFRKAFHECPDIWPGKAELNAINPFNRFTDRYDESERRCCCYNPALTRGNTKKVPHWVLHGICLPDTGPARLVAEMWRVSTDEPGNTVNGSVTECPPGKARYHLTPEHGRCLTLEIDTYQAAKAFAELEKTSVVPKEDDVSSFFPTLRKTSKPPWSKYVCPGELGLHHEGCHCNWVGDFCPSHYESS